MFKRHRSLTGDDLHEWYHTVQQTILAYQVTIIYPSLMQAIVCIYVIVCMLMCVRM